MSEDTLIAIVAISCVFGAPMLWLIVDSLASNWRKAHIAEQNALLKREMIERGFSAEEIVQVVGSGPGVKDHFTGFRKGKPVAVDE
jgi:hypothetical protein